MQKLVRDHPILSRVGGRDAIAHAQKNRRTAVADGFPARRSAAAALDDHERPFGREPSEIGGDPVDGAPDPRDDLGVRKGLPARRNRGDDARRAADDILFVEPAEHREAGSIQRIGARLERVGGAVGGRTSARGEARRRESGDVNAKSPRLGRRIRSEQPRRGGGDDDVLERDCRVRVSESDTRFVQRKAVPNAADRIGTSMARPTPAPPRRPTAFASRPGRSTRRLGRSASPGRRPTVRWGRPPRTRRQSRGRQSLLFRRAPRTATRRGRCPDRRGPMARRAPTRVCSRRPRRAKEHVPGGCTLPSTDTTHRRARPRPRSSIRSASWAT